MLKRIKKYRKLKKYAPYIVPIIGNMEVKAETKDGFLVKANLEETFHFVIEGNEIALYYIDSYQTLQLKTITSDKVVIVNKMLKENCKEGTILEKCEYCYPLAQREAPHLHSFISSRYIYDHTVPMSRLKETTTDSELAKDASMKTKLRIFENGKVLVNDNDISPLYRNVKKARFVERVHDLFFGIISKESYGELYNIHLGYLPRDCFQYRETLGITEEEEKIAVPYEENTNHNDGEAFYDFLLLIKDVEGVFTEEDCNRLRGGKKKHLTS